MIYIMYSPPATDAALKQQWGWRGGAEGRKKGRGSVCVAHFDYKRAKEEKLHYMGE